MLATNAIMDEQVLRGEVGNHQRRRFQRENKGTYLRGEWPLVERANDQRPVSQGQGPGGLVGVDALFGREGGVGQWLEETTCTRSKRTKWIRMSAQ